MFWVDCRFSSNVHCPAFLVNNYACFVVNNYAYLHMKTTTIPSPCLFPMVLVIFIFSPVKFSK